ncbi:hypothetical protein D3C78_1727580 [compost metagenome]
MLCVSVKKYPKMCAPRMISTIMQLVCAARVSAAFAVLNVTVLALQANRKAPKAPIPEASVGVATPV